MRWTRHLASSAMAALGLVLALASPAAADKPRLVPTNNDFLPLKWDGKISYRTFYSEDDTKQPFNMSVFPGRSDFNRTSGLGMYGYTFIWSGRAYDPKRPLIVYYGSSASRCWDVYDPLCVVNQGCYEGWPWGVRQSSQINKGLLTDAGFGIIAVVMPYCYNTTSNSVRYNDCLNPDHIHVLKHYRPNIVKDIMAKVKTRFGYNASAVVGAGQSMGARGILRLGTSTPMRAISLTGGNLETYQDAFMKGLPWNAGQGGESCWTLKNPNVNGYPCTWPVPATMSLASKLINTKVNIYASVGDAVANLTTQVTPTCTAINAAAASASPPQGRACAIQAMTEPKTPGFDGPSHVGLMRYGYQYPDINFLHTALGREAIVWTDTPPPPRG